MTICILLPSARNHRWLVESRRGGSFSCRDFASGKISGSVVDARQEEWKFRSRFVHAVHLASATLIPLYSCKFFRIPGLCTPTYEVSGII